MTKRTLTLLLTLALALCAAAAMAQAAPITVQDMYGREITLPEPASRVVAVSAADCEILCALDCGETLVGRGAYCDYPEGILDVPVVESGANTNVEQILALNPQIVFMSDMAQHPEVVEALEAAGVRVAVSNADTIDGVYTAIRMIGTLMGKEERAENIIADMEKTFEEIRALSAASGAAGKTVYFEVSPLQWGLWTAGNGTFMQELAQMCGLVNLFEDVQGWAEVSEEQVLARDPDFIVTTTMYFGEGPTPVEEILSRVSWQSLKAVQNGAVFNADSNEITRPGPRLRDAAEALYQFVKNEEEAAEPAV